MKKAFLVTSLVLASYLSMSQVYRSTSSFVEKKPELESKIVEQDSVKNVSQDSFLESTFIEKSTEKAQPEALENIINLGSISIGDQINSFRIKVDEQQGTLIKKPTDLLYEGKKIGELHYNDGFWEFNGTLKDLALGDNYFKTVFVNDLGLESLYSLKLITTNESPVPQQLKYVFSSKSGETIEGIVNPLKVNGTFMYNIGDVFGKYFLSELSLKVIDEDDNLITENIFFNLNDVVVGNFTYNEEDNTFNYKREDSQNRGLGTYSGLIHIKDKSKASASINLIYAKIGEPPKVQEVYITTEKGVKIDLDFTPEIQESSKKRRKK